MENKGKPASLIMKIMPIIIISLTIILIGINLLIPLMGNSLADAHAQMLEANDLFGEEPINPMDFSIENMPNPAAHLGYLNAAILGIQLILMITLVLLHKKHEQQT